MSDPTTLMGDILAGNAMLEDVDDWVEAWHTAGGAPNGVRQSLDEYLGLSSDEADLWVEQPVALRFAVAAHRYHRPVQEILESKDEQAVRARAGAPEAARQVLDWLRKTGRLEDPTEP
jgi:hypothetical protein